MKRLPGARSGITLAIARASFNRSVATWGWSCSGMIVPAPDRDHGPLLRQPLDDILPGLRFARAHCRDLHVGRGVAPRQRLLEAIEHADDNPRFGRLAFNADVEAAADQIATAKRLYGGL